MPKEPISVEEQLRLIELEERKQALESRKLGDELARIQLGKLKMEAESVRHNKETGQKNALEAIAARDEMRRRCNHRTGGQGAEAIAFGQGDEERPTCIGAQVFLDETIRLMCGRCGDECRSNDPDRAKWAKWVQLWKHSVNKQMMVIGGLKVRKQPEVTV